MTTGDDPGLPEPLAAPRRLLPRTRKGRIGAALSAGASLATILSLFLVAGHNSSSTNSGAGQSSPPGPVFAYPVNVESNYLNGCEENAPVASCQCTLTWFENDVPLARFIADESQMEAGSEPADAVAAVQACG